LNTNLNINNAEIINLLCARYVQTMVRVTMYTVISTFVSAVMSLAHLTMYFYVSENRIEDI